MPVAGEEDDEAVLGCVAIEEMGLGRIVVIVYHVFLLVILAIGRTCGMVEQGEALGASYHILEVDVFVVAFGAALLQWLVLAVLDACHEGCPLNGVTALRNVEQVGLRKPAEERLPLRRILVILLVKLRQVDGRMWFCCRESIAPETLPGPLADFLLCLCACADNAQSQQ